MLNYDDCLDKKNVEKCIDKKITKMTEKDLESFGDSRATNKKSIEQAIKLQNDYKDDLHIEEK